jgi:hypothetical protein
VNCCEERKGKREKRKGKCREGGKEVDERMAIQKISDASEHLSAHTRLYPQIQPKPAPPNHFRRVTNTPVAMAATISLSTSHNTTPPPQFTPLEQELLAEYQKLVTNMNTVLPPPLAFGTRR